MRRLLSVLFLVAACKPAAAPPPAGLADADRAAIQKAIEDAQARFNAQPPDFHAHSTAYYVPDAVFMPPNLPEIKGATEIGNWMASYPAVANTKFTIADMDGSGDWAYVHGTFEMDVTAPGTTVAVHDKGKFLEIWKKQADGSWRVVRDIFNSDLPVTMMDVKKKP